MDYIGLILTVSGWIIGPFVGYYLKRRSQEKDTQERAEQLRQQFITELQEIEEPLHSWPDEPPWEDEDRGYVVPDLSNAGPTKVYDEHITEMRILEENEIEKITGFYTSFQRTQEICERYIEKLPDNFDYNNEAEKTAEIVHNSIQGLKESHQDVMKELQT